MMYDFLNTISTIREAGVFRQNRDLIFVLDHRASDPVTLVITDREGRVLRSETMTSVPERPALLSCRVSGFDSDTMAYYYESDGKRLQDPWALSVRDGLCFIPRRFSMNPLMKSPAIAMCDRLIYKLHVKGFTAQAPLPQPQRGTFRGLERRLPYIKDLGFNTIELMPVYDFDESLKVSMYSRLISGRKNYWGYAETNQYVALKQAYASTANPPREFLSLVDAAHRLGMSCFMEIYFPYGTPVLQALRVVRFWHEYYHIDGFRFLGCGVNERVFREDPALSEAVLIFEYADTDSFKTTEARLAKRVALENDSFRRTLRSFLKSDAGLVVEAVQKLMMNPPYHAAINDMANVGTLTLWDAVSYNYKHNEANGEDNADGTNDNWSWNCGVEGKTRRNEVLSLRKRQVKNALAYIFLSQGVPLLNMGDERGNTQMGNNNAYASDDPLGWINWRKNPWAEELTAYVRQLISLRKAYPVLHAAKAVRENEKIAGGYPRFSLHDGKPWFYDFNKESRAFAVMYGWEADDSCHFLYIAYNADWNSHDFALPLSEMAVSWTLLVDTGQMGAAAACPITNGGDGDADQKLTAMPRSVVVLTTSYKKEKLCH